jgi:DNA-binding transcriptional MocR family regulator
MRRRRKGRKVDATGRSKGDGQFIPIPHMMANSPAFRSLSGPALKIWVELRSRFNGYNNGKLSLSLNAAATLLGMSKSTAARAFEELETKGFIILRLQGHWYGRRASEWIVTDQKYGDRPSTRNWERWRPRDAMPEKQNTVPVPNRRNGTAPPEYPSPADASHERTRHGAPREIDGAG